MDKVKEFFSQKRYIRRILIVAYFSIMAASVLYVMFFVYRPEQTAPGALGSTYMDIICMLIMLILVLNLIFEKREIGRTTKLFLGLMLGTTWALFFDFLTWSLDGKLQYSNWTYIFTIASLCSGAILGALLELYLSSYLSDMYNLDSSIKHAGVCVILNIIAFIITLTLAVTHSAFEFVDGHYELGELYDVITVIPILTIVYMIGYVIAHVKIIGIHDVIAAILYVLTMIVGVVIEAVHGIGATYVSITISDVFIFVMLQNNLIESSMKQQEELKKNVEKWMRRSNTDEVTGFLNRHAYEEEIASLEKRGVKDNFVYVSMDVNGLKVVNDTKGHDAGDELLIGASICMKQCFSSYGKLYRIGGDEFVALIYAGISELETIMKEFEEMAEEWRGILTECLTISCGYVRKCEDENMTLHQMATLADKRMYINKSFFYQRNGIDRRGQRDAHIALHGMYAKILKIDIANDTYQIVNMNESEQSEEMGFSPKLSEWFYNFAEKGMVHPDDKDEFLANTKLNNMRNISLRVFYRRKLGDKYRQVMMEIIPANDDKMFLYVKDIDK